MSRSTAKTNSDHTRELAKLKKLRGQIEGVEKMINEYRYCGEILAQVRSIRAGFLGIEASILETHLKNCVTEAIEQKRLDEANCKIEEIIQLFRKSSTSGVQL